MANDSSDLGCAVPRTVLSFGDFLYILRVPQRTLREQERRSTLTSQLAGKDGGDAGTGEQSGHGQGQGQRSDGQPEGADDAVHGLVLPSHCAAPCGGQRHRGTGT